MKKVSAYTKSMNPQYMDELREKILDIIVMQKKYKDSSYSALQLAKDLETDSRYVSAVFSLKFHMNYSTFVNKYRTEEAMGLLLDKRYSDMNVDEIGHSVGFATRQSFYNSFVALVGVTPREYRVMNKKGKSLIKNFD